MTDMEEKLLEVIENNARISETLIQVNQSIAKGNEELIKNVEKLNDTFPLHCIEQGDIKKEVVLIRTELLNYIKILIVAVIILLGGAQLLKLLGIL